MDINTEEKVWIINKHGRAKKKSPNQNKSKQNKKSERFLI